jgi:3-oxoacyl-[acyl-carrier protein] reductase
MSKIDLSGKSALVTGAGRGIGRATAILLGQSGAAVAVNYSKSEKAAKEVVQEIEKYGSKAIAIHADVTDENQVNAMVEQISKTFDGLDILVNNVGGLIGKTTIEKMPTPLWEEAIKLNLTSTFLVTRAAIPKMRGRNGATIVNMSSVVSRMGVPNEVHYCVVKAGVSALTRGLALELAGDGIRVNGIAPGITATDFHKGLTDPRVLDSVTDGMPIKRQGKPEEIARLVLVLASDWSSYMTGEIIEVNGGLLMN